MKTYKKLFAATILTASIFATQSAKSNDFLKTYKEQIIAKAKNVLFKTHGVKNFEEFRKHYRSLINLTLLREKNANFCMARLPLIFFAISINDVNLVRKLISMGANANHTLKSTSLTPLSMLIAYAAIFKFDPTQLAELLIKHGADPKVRNYQGKNAIDIAKFYGLNKILKVFKKYGYC